jgi:hypothetical protein
LNSGECLSAFCGIFLKCDKTIHGF